MNILLPIAVIYSYTFSTTSARGKRKSEGIASSAGIIRNIMRLMLKMVIMNMTMTPTSLII